MVGGLEPFSVSPRPLIFGFGANGLGPGLINSMSSLGVGGRRKYVNIMYIWFLGVGMVVGVMRSSEALKTTVMLLSEQ